MYPDGYGQRVLIVDDDVHVRALLSALLTYEGYNVFEAGDGLEAVEELQKRHFDAVVSDCQMPRFDGMQLLAMCQLLWPETAVVLVSGEGSSWIELAIQRGAHAWVRKPYGQFELITSVRRAIEKVSARTASYGVQA